MEDREVNIRLTINRVIEVLEKELSKKKKKLKKEEFYEIMQDLEGLFNEYATLNPDECGKLVVKRYIKIINHLMRIDVVGERQAGYCKQLENAYKLGGRVSLEHFIIYYEWDWNKEDKLLENRFSILESYIFFLNKMCFDREFEGIIANLPSGYGKSRVCRYYEAFRLGRESGGTFLALCSNDALIKGQSRSVIDIIKSERFGDIFPHLKYDKEDKDFFLKETDGEWKLRDCKMVASYYANTVRSNVVGIRASLSIDIDDLYADADEALDENLNKRYYDKFVTVWRKRYIQNKIPQVIITGTLWSPTDFLAKVIRLWESEGKFVPHDRFKYTRISKDGKKVIIQVPALDYETGLSSCPEFKSTEELLTEKMSMSTYLWETNFQQRATSPEGLYFAWENLKTYEIMPMRENNECYAVLDPNRKGNDYISLPIFSQIHDEHYLVDCFFTQKSLKASYDDICSAIIRNKVKVLVVETNVETSIADILYEKLAEKSYYEIKIIEKYNTVPKIERINKFKDVILRKIVFPGKTLYGISTMMGQALEQMTTFSFDKNNKHDDMIDSLAIYADQVIEENGLSNKAEPFKRPF